MPHQVIKRDGSMQPYDDEKIKSAMRKAGCADVDQAMLFIRFNGDDDVTVERIHTLVENALMVSGDHDAARNYIEYRTQRDKARSDRHHPDARALRDYIVVSKYARYQPELGRREVFPEVVDRSRDMMVRRFPELEDEIHDAYEFVHDGRVLGSMRAMQFAGIAAEANHCRMYNCAFTHCNRGRVFGETFWALLSGCGAGVSLQFQHVEQLAPVVRIDEHKVVHHTVGDSIEGWADAVNALVRSYLVDGTNVEFNYSDIRPRGIGARHYGREGTRTPSVEASAGERPVGASWRDGSQASPHRVYGHLLLPGRGCPCRWHPS